jgi:hypothetical protein
VASTHGLVASPFKAAYVAAKHGIVGLTKVTALETVEEGITCNAICPGYVFTPLVEAQIEGQARSYGIPREKVIRDIFLAQQPDKGFATVEEMGAIAVFLASEGAASITENCAACRWWLDSPLRTIKMADPVNRAKRQISPCKGEVEICLNMRGLAGEGAFGWGVLDGLLIEPPIRIQRICAAATGALNAVASASGLASGGQRGASLALADLWRRIARDRLFEESNQIRADKMSAVRRLLDQMVDFFRIHVFLMIGRSGRYASRIVANRKISITQGLSAVSTLEEAEATRGRAEDPARIEVVAGNDREASPRSPVKVHDLNMFLMLHDAGRRHAPGLLETAFTPSDKVPTTAAPTSRKHVANISRIPSNTSVVSVHITRCCGV